MKRWQLCCATFLFLLGPSGYLCAAPEVFDFTLHVHGEPLHVVLRADRFEPKGHRFTRANGGKVLVDGVPAIGTDSFDPQVHLSRFEVNWNGRELAIPRKCFEFVFNPSLEKKRTSFDNKGSVLVLPNDVGDSILIMLSGGDAAGSFNAWWIVWKNGRVDRFSDGPP